MQKALATQGYIVSQNELLSDVIDLYESLCVDGQNNIYDESDMMSNINQPLYKTEVMENMETLLSFDWKTGASFIRDERLVLDCKISIICILAGTLYMGTNIDIETEYVIKQKNIYKVIPKFFVDAAKEARFHDGFRLLKRCLRHALDPQTPSILQAKACVVEYKDKIAIKIETQMKASMKKDVYDVTVVFHEKILACKCGCKAGSSGQERVMCVHILPVVYQVTLLMYDGLAEHMLCELCNAWNTTYEEAVNNSSSYAIEYCKRSILVLKQATGYDCTDYNADLKKSVIDLLANYNVGTQKK
jgi:hypothetical protein